MRLKGTRPQMSGQLELPLEGRGETPRVQRSEEASLAARATEGSGRSDLMEMVVRRPNLQTALRRVRSNKGSPGIDGMTVDELSAYLKGHWEEIREQLLAGTYRPQEVKRQLIPKSGGGMRELGIPTVLDRFIQQALLQVLQSELDGSFSDHSYGFRPGRSAHEAVCAAQRYVQEGRRWVVDVDLEKFFDRVNHDVLMGKLCKRIGDRRVLVIIRRYLEAGIMTHGGVVIERVEGTPQGGPLSPLLANVLLDTVDKELEKHGHRVVRYADDCNVYVHSRRAGERVMCLLRKLFAELKLQVNESKSAVDLARRRKILGYSFWTASGGMVKRRVSRKALHTMKDRVRQITQRTRGRSVQQVVLELRSYLVGWKEYYRLADTPKIFNDLDEWIRHRLRALHLKQWKRGTTVYRELRSRGMSHSSAAQVAASARRWWHNSAMAIHVALPNAYFDQLQLPRLAG
ncbi:MAG TPA: group II intron reverse transcriptase/maturase [Bacteroidota bacterium]|nr:group II intron reverse transcriptase/maturase [Bacteroidota bacterium]